MKRDLPLLVFFLFIILTTVISELPSQVARQQESGSHHQESQRAPASSNKAPEQRTRLMRTKLKYPLIRVVETIQRDATETHTLSRIAMVADHVLVRLQVGHTQTELATLASRFDGTVQQMHGKQSYYIVYFDGSDVKTLDLALSVLNENTTLVARAGPDYVVGIPDGELQ